MSHDQPDPQWTPDGDTRAVFTLANARLTVEYVSDFFPLVAVRWTAEFLYDGAVAVCKKGRAATEDDAKKEAVQAIHAILSNLYDYAKATTLAFYAITREEDLP